MPIKRDRGHIFIGDAFEILRGLPDESVQTCVTSPPYFGLRSYFPAAVRLRADAPAWVQEELERRGIFPLDPTKDLKP